MDASSGLAISKRRGLGRIKHIETVFLWIQELVSSGRIKVGKKHTSEMIADCLTKPLDALSIWKHVQAMNFWRTNGRHALALDV